MASYMHMDDAYGSHPLNKDIWIAVILHACRKDAPHCCLNMINIKLIIRKALTVLCSGYLYGSLHKVDKALVGLKAICHCTYINSPHIQCITD